MRPTAEYLERIDNRAVFSIGKIEELIETGSDAQRSVILLEIPHLAEHCFGETTERILPQICVQVERWSADLQLSAAEALAEITKRSLSPPRAKEVCTAAFRVVNISNSEQVYEAWGEILVAALPSVHWLPEELARVVALLDAHCAAKKDISRKLTARVLGSLALCIKQKEVETIILPRALPLAEDANADVRGMLSESLAFIGSSVSVGTVEVTVWPCLLRLLSDDDQRVHAASLRSISCIIQSHREKVGPDVIKQCKLFTHLLPPILFRECEFSRKAAAEDQRNVSEGVYLLLEMTAEVFGELAYSVHQSSKDPYPRKEAFKAFVTMATCNGPVIRRHCAFNFPGVALSFSSKYSTHLSSIVEFLSRDPDPETRWILAAGIHEVARALSDKEMPVSNVYRAIMNLLKDSNPLVRMNVLRNFHHTLKEITKNALYTTAGKLAPLCHALTQLSNGTWRMQELLAKQLELCADYIPSDAIRTIILPVLYQVAEESSHIVRKAAMAGIVQCLRNICTPVERDEAMNAFDIEWGQSGVYWMRIAYIDAAAAATSSFSNLLFRDLFAAKVLRLANDPVVNVRLRLSGVFEKFAPACVQMDEFRIALNTLKSDEDIDIKGRMQNMDLKVEAALEEAQKNSENDFEREQHERDIFRHHLQSKVDDYKRKRSRHRSIKSIYKLSIDAINEEASEVSRLPTDVDESKVRSPLKSQPTNLVKKLKSDEESPRSIVDSQDSKSAVPAPLNLKDAGAADELSGNDTTGTTSPVSASPLAKRIKGWFSPRKSKNKAEQQTVQ